MSMIVGLATTRRLLVDLATIRKAGRVDELKQRCEAARKTRRTPDADDHRLDAALLITLLGHEYDGVVNLAAAELQTPQATVQRTIQQLAAEIREAG